MQKTLHRSGLALALFLGASSLSLAQNEEAVFRYTPTTQATTVALTGSHFDWAPDAVLMEQVTSGTWTTTVSLPRGKHLYKYVVNGRRWHHDPENPRREDDGHGGYNSVLWIGQEPDGAPQSITDATTTSADMNVWVWGATSLMLDGVPPDWQESTAPAWIPVKLQAERPVYDANSTSGARLLMSRDLIDLPTSLRSPTTTFPLQKRRILVWLPPGYDEHPQRRYPVLYMHDGQNVFDDSACCYGHGGWAVNRALEAMGPSGQVIVVAVPNSPRRMLEYSPGPDLMAPKSTQYATYLCDVIKPLIDRTFRTRPEPQHTALAGSSMGGLVSLSVAIMRPKVFGRVAALSTAFQIRDRKGTSVLDAIREKTHAALPFRFYLDSGTGGNWEDGAPLTRKMAELAPTVGWKPGVDFLHVEEAGADHNERSWKRRTPKMLEFLLQGTGPVDEAPKATSATRESLTTSTAKTDPTPTSKANNPGRKRRR